MTGEFIKVTADKNLGQSAAQSLQKNWYFLIGPEHPQKQQTNV
jgi:hypothetical protein